MEIAQFKALFCARSFIAMGKSTRHQGIIGLLELVAQLG
jgi:hypothetical protein